MREVGALAAAAAVGVGLLLVWALGRTGDLNGPVALLIVVPPLVSYLLGTSAGLAAGLAGVALMAAGLQATGGSSFNPLFEMITLGPWAAGRVVRSRRRLAEQIESRNRELEAERALFALESVRYERARIARELHDIVAHCVSVIVVQAAAGQRPAADRAAEALAVIADAAAEARTELGLLTRHLDGAAAPARIDELARRAAATGLTVRYLPSGDLSKLVPPASDAAYRIVQESLTNAIKHAPGAPVEVAVRGTATAVVIEVTSGPPGPGSSGLETSGGGSGVAGMRRRVASCGGTLDAGPTADGGWRVLARLPARTVGVETVPVSVG